MERGKTSGFCTLRYKPQILIPRESDLKATRRALYVERLSIARRLQVNTSGEYIIYDYLLLKSLECRLGMPTRNE